MKRASITPAQIVFDTDGTPRSSAFADVYHSRAGAIAQAQEVFLKGNGLPERWAGRERFVILETGFGLGQNFLATWQAWANATNAANADAKAQLWFVSIEKHPVPKAAAARALAVHEGTALEAQARALLNAWPAASPDGFRASFEGGRVNLQVIHADVAEALREWRVQADAVYLDGFNPRLNPDMWSPHVFKALASRLAPGCTAATWSSKKIVVDGLVQAGFEVERVPGFADKRWRLQARLTRVGKKARADHPASPALINPAALPNRSSTDTPSHWKPGDPPALIIGAGLAGAACAQALSASGVPSLVLDQADQPAQGASGNPAGLFHGVLHPEDGAHARLGRAAAWMAHRHYAPLISQGVMGGQAHGLLRREDEANTPQMQALIDRLGLPPEYVQALPAMRVQEGLQTALADPQPAWFYPGGGWMAPAAWVAQALKRPGVEFRGGSCARQIRRQGAEWQVLGPDGEVLAQTRHLVLCAAAEVLRLLPSSLVAEWPVGEQRGQITRIPKHHLPAAGPALPFSGSGYALTLENGDVLCGATANRDDTDATLRASDHLQNLQRLNRLLGWRINAKPGELQGRVGWRFHTADRLPIVGPIQAFSPANAALQIKRTNTRAAHPGNPQISHQITRLRDLPTEPGLYAATALGSRGITWAPMVGAVIAHAITGEPAPLPASLLEAIDPRRFALKRARRAKR